MNFDDQRKLALRLFPELASLFADRKNCFSDIYEAIEALPAKARKKMLETVDQWPSEWAYWWAYYIGDKEVMIDRVTESKWAFWWAHDIGDREIMINRVTEEYWVDAWCHDIGPHPLKKGQGWFLNGSSRYQSNFPSSPYTRSV